jgi:SAM-dependent methyltransferase
MDVKSHYENHLYHFYTWMLGDFTQKSKEQFNLFQSLDIYPQSNKIALDLGAGNGVQTLALAQLGFEITAIDFSIGLLAELEQNTLEFKPTIVEGDIRQVSDYQLLRPELIICGGDTLAHLHNWTEIEKFIYDCNATLGNQGKLLIGFRDYTQELLGEKRFIPVKSDTHRILTCFLEYLPENVVVTDLLYEKNGEKWEQKISSYSKVRLQKDRVVNIIQNVGMNIIEVKQSGGFLHILAMKISN